MIGVNLLLNVLDRVIVSFGLDNLLEHFVLYLPLVNVLNVQLHHLSYLTLNDEWYHLIDLLLLCLDHHHGQVDVSHLLHCSILTHCYALMYEVSQLSELYKSQGTIWDYLVYVCVIS